MIKDVLYWTEKTIHSIFIGLSSLGLFLVVLFISYKLAGDAALEFSWELVMMLASILIVLGLDTILLNVRYRRLELEADDLEAEIALRKSGFSVEEADKVYEHLRVK